MQNGLVKGQIRHQLFEPGVFFLQALELFNLVQLHLPVLLSPVIVGGIADLQLPANLLDGTARREGRIGLP